jgi:uroporphyrinogen-III decarboxylase
VIGSPDNITGDINSPSIFRKYHLPFYNKCGALLHERKKTYVVHMDGKLNALKDLVQEANFDVVESFSLPMAGGDYPIRDALEHWSNKSIAANVVASLCMKSQEEIEKNVQELLTDLSGKKNFMLQVSEDLPHRYWQKGLPVILQTVYGKGS